MGDHLGELWIGFCRFIVVDCFSEVQNAVTDLKSTSIHTNIISIDIISLSMTPQYATPESSPDTSTVVRNDALQKFSPCLLLLLRMQFYVTFGDKLTFMLKIASAIIPTLIAVTFL